MANLFNIKNTTEAMKAVDNKKIGIAGLGAIGSLIAEMLVRNGAKHIVMWDIDRYEAGNIPKSSFAIRYPEDIGKHKAVILADRLRAIAANNSYIAGYDLNVKMLGPLAFSGLDYLIVALDNAAMKIHLARMIKMCPEDMRPVCLSCGTNEEFSESMLFSNTGACLKCTIPESWMKDISSEMIWSCSAKVNYLLPEKFQVPTSTSGVAGIASALDIDNLILDHANGTSEFKESIRMTRSVYNRCGSRTEIMRSKKCPVCSIEPPEDVKVINGFTPVTTLRELLESISGYFSKEFILRVNPLLIPGSPDRTYNQFVLYDNCRICGKQIPVMKHAGFIREDEIFCDSCNSGISSKEKQSDRSEPVQTRTFSLKDTDDTVLDMTLFELGYPIGCYYEAEEVSILKEEKREITLEDFDIEALTSKSITVSLSGDHGFFSIGSPIPRDSEDPFKFYKEHHIIPVNEYPKNIKNTSPYLAHVICFNETDRYCR